MRIFSTSQNYDQNCFVWVNMVVRKNQSGRSNHLTQMPNWAVFSKICRIKFPYCLRRSCILTIWTVFYTVLDFKTIHFDNFGPSTFNNTDHYFIQLTFPFWPRPTSLAQDIFASVQFQATIHFKDRLLSLTEDLTCSTGCFWTICLNWNDYFDPSCVLIQDRSIQNPNCFEVNYLPLVGSSTFQAS